jgi:hypothetical protein
MGRELLRREFLALAESGFPGWETTSRRRQRTTYDPVAAEHRCETTVVTSPFVVAVVPIREQWTAAEAAVFPGRRGVMGLLTDSAREWCRNTLQGDHYCSWYRGRVVGHFQRGGDAGMFRLRWDYGR